LSHLPASLPHYFGAPLLTLGCLRKTPPYHGFAVVKIPLSKMAIAKRRRNEVEKIRPQLKHGTIKPKD